MPFSCSSAHAKERTRPLIPVGIAIALVVPVTLFRFADFEVNLALVLAPLAGLSLTRAPAMLRNLFLACVMAGLASILSATLILGDQFTPRYLFSLVLVLASPLYFFLGSYLCDRHYQFDRLLVVLAVVSAVFVATVALGVIASGSQVRWYAGPLGHVILNLTFAGLPLYGSFGALSLASLFVVQMFVIGAAFASPRPRWMQFVLVTGFGAAAFLVIGSNVRSVHLVGPYLVVMLGLAVVVCSPPIKVRAGILLAVGILAAGYSVSRMVGGLRVVSTGRELSSLLSEGAARTSDTKRLPESTQPSNGSVDLEKLSTGRMSLIEDAVQEIALSPLFGTGFASYNRVDPKVGERSKQSGNRTTHIHYLTILWKGGVLFFVPYMALMGAFWISAVRGSLPRVPEGVGFLLAGLLFIFGALSLTWDILLVPSAGAYTFFLLGAVAHSARRVGLNDHQVMNPVITCPGLSSSRSSERAQGRCDE